MDEIKQANRRIEKIGKEIDSLNRAPSVNSHEVRHVKGRWSLLNLSLIIILIIMGLILVPSYLEQSQLTGLDVFVQNQTEDLLNVTAEVRDSKGNLVQADVVFEDIITGNHKDKTRLPRGKYKVKIDFQRANISVKHVDMADMDVQDAAGFLKVDDVPRKPKLKRFAEVYAIDPTSISFTEASVTAEAKGTELYKCKEWDFAAQQCLGEWSWVMDIVPGQNYTFTLTPDDPGFGETFADTYYMFESTDPQYGSYRQLLNQTVGGTQYTSGTIDLSATGIQCFTEEWVSQNWTGRTAVNGTWNFTVYGYCDHAGPAAYLFARIFKVNSSGEYNFQNTTQAGSNMCTAAITTNTISYALPYSSYTDLQPGERIGLGFCLNVLVLKNGKTAVIYWEEATPSNVDFPVAEWDDTPPQIAFVSPTDQSGTLLPQEYILVNATASDANLANITINLYNSTQDLINSAATTTSPNFVNFTGLSPGSYYFNATAYDSVGERNSTETRNVTIELLTITLADAYSLNSSDEPNGEFNTSNLEEIEYLNLNFSINSSGTIDSWYLNFTADGFNGCSPGNKQSLVCYNYDNYPYNWIQFINNTDTATYDGTLGNQGDRIVETVIGGGSSIDLGYLIDEHYNPNVFKWYDGRLNFSDVKWQDTAAAINGSGLFVRVEIDHNTVPLDADQYKLDFRVQHNNPENPLEAYACNSSYVNGHPHDLEECALITLKYPWELQDDGTKFRGIFTQELVDELGDIKYIVLEHHDTNYSSYYAIKTYKATKPAYTTHWEYSDDSAQTWNNLGDGYETEMNINWFYDGAEPTGFVYRLWANTTIGAEDYLEGKVMWDIDATNNYPPLLSIARPVPGSTVTFPYLVEFSIAEPNDDTINTSLLLYQGGVLNRTLAVNMNPSNDSYYWYDDTPDGTYDLVLLACENNTADLFCSNDTHTITLFRDVINPDVTDVSAVPSAVALGDSTNIYANVTDSVELENATARMTYPNSTVVDYLMSGIGGDIYSYIFTTTFIMPIGQYNVTIMAYDAAGNLNDTEKTDFTTYDAPPDFNSYYATPDPVAVNQTIRIYANVTDNAAVDSVIVYVNGSNYSMIRNTTLVQNIVVVTTSTGDCTFSLGSTAEQANSTDDYRSLIDLTTCGWNVEDIDEPLFVRFNNMTVYVEHVAETGVSPSSATLYVGNSTSTSEYGSTVLSTNEGDQNVLEASQGLAVTGEGTDSFVASSLPATVDELNNLQIRINHNDAGGNDIRGVDHIYVELTYDVYTDAYYADINASAFPVGQNNYTIYANDTAGQTNSVGGSFDVDYQHPPEANITSPANGSVFQQGDDVNLTGNATDFEDGNLTKGSLVWSSSIDGLLGTGRHLMFATLTPGNHTINLTATDSFGLTSSASVDIEVEAELCPGMNAGHFTLVNITVDGNISDWDPVLQNPANQIFDGISGVNDPDITQTADKDIRRYAMTWNQDWIWFYLRRSSGGSNVIGLDSYFDSDQDDLLTSNDRVLVVDWSGSNRLYDSTLYNYTPVNVSGDPILGDGETQPGSISNPVSLESKVLGGSEEGIEIEFRISWADLGASACIPVVGHISTTHGSGTNIPSQIEDNAARFDTRIFSLEFYPDSIKSGQQGTTVTHAHTLKNKGNIPDLYNLNITGTRAGYNVTLYFANGTLLTDTDGDGRIDTGLITPLYGVTLYFNVSIPPTAVSGDIDITTITAYSNTSNTTSASVVDMTVVGAISVIPSNEGAATTNSTVEYSHTIYNNGIASIVNVGAQSDQGYTVTVHYTNGTQATDTNSDTYPDIGYVQAESSKNILVRVQVPPSATVGTLDNTTVFANSTYGESGKNYDLTTVSNPLQIIPNITRAVGQGTTVFLPHYITFVSSTPAVVDIEYNQTQNYALLFYYDDYVTLLTDTDGDSVIDAGLFQANGYTKTIVAKMSIPLPAEINTTEVVYYNVSTNITTYYGWARDNISVQKLVTYEDSQFNIQRYYFEQGDQIYVQAYALDMAWVYFQWLDPNATVRRLSPDLPVDVLQTADDTYDLNSSDLSGKWTLIIYNKQGDVEITRIEFWVNTPPVVSSVSDFPDPVYQGEGVLFLANVTAGEENWFVNETVVLGALLEIDGKNYSMTGPGTPTGIGQYSFDGLVTSNLSADTYTYRVFAYDNFAFFNVSDPVSGTLVVKEYNFTNASGLITDSRYNTVNASMYIYNSTGSLVWTDDQNYSFILDRSDLYTISIFPDSGSINEITYINATLPTQLLNFTRMEDALENETDKPDEITDWTEAVAWWTHPQFYFVQTRLNFSYGAGTDLYFWKCSDWNFDERSCTGNNFNIIQNLSDGPAWAVVYLAPGDPGAGAGRAPDYNESLNVWDVTGLNETERRDNGTFVGEFYDLESINFTLSKAYRFEVFVTQVNEKGRGILRDPYYDNIHDDWIVDVTGLDSPNITQINGSVVVDDFVPTLVSGTEAGTQKLIWDSAPPNKTISDIDVNETVKLWFVVDIPGNSTNDTHTGHFLGKSKGQDAELTNYLMLLVGSPPYKVNLTYPDNGNNTLVNRTLMFIWEPAYDPDNQTLKYEINITSELCSDIYDSNIYGTNYTSIYDLGTYDDCGSYNWSVRASDGYFYGNWSDSWNFSIQPYVALAFVTATVDFGDADNDIINDTTDDDPFPFIIQSDGNVVTDVINVTANQSFFTGSSAADSDFQLMVDNTTEAGAFNWTGSANYWINLTTIQMIIDQFDWHDVNDSAEIEVKVHVPIDEPPGLKITGLVFYGEQS
ncbi:hypothetical protein ACFL3V_03155 [Nanoarchaeota archaeon]